MRRFLLILLCTLFVQCSCMAQDEANGEITGEYYYYELSIPGDEEKSRWPLIMAGVSCRNVLEGIVKIPSYENVLKSFYAMVTFCPDIYLGYITLMNETFPEKKDFTLDALSLQDAIANNSSSLDYCLADGTCCHLKYCRMRATFVIRNNKDYSTSIDGSELLSTDYKCMVLKDIDYLILPFQTFKSRYLNDIHSKAQDKKIEKNKRKYAEKKRKGEEHSRGNKR